jgi:hypothetical protein
LFNRYVNVLDELLPFDVVATAHINEVVEYGPGCRRQIHAVFHVGFEDLARKLVKIRGYGVSYIFYVQ